MIDIQPINKPKPYVPKTPIQEYSPPPQLSKHNSKIVNLTGHVYVGKPVIYLEGWLKKNYSPGAKNGGEFSFENYDGPYTLNTVELFDAFVKDNIFSNHIITVVDSDGETVITVVDRRLTYLNGNIVPNNIWDPTTETFVESY